MKILLTLLIAIISVKSYSEVLYCIEDKTVGMDTSENHRSTNFDTQKFTLEVDIENLKVYSDRLFFAKDVPENITCIKPDDIGADRLMCVTTLGNTLILFLNNYSFAHSELPVSKDDDLAVTIGKCEKF